uniref:DUF985 domain-containing protein n=1 Tax=Candidatus Kentrum sp. TUN TaxID=2126343 RepID=A0A450ZU16_9GAMM|nr:MAG: hypothetical protein BECKTUN1418D_GA0071000_10084 [Candidatus Kentron sp. TUN]VFK57247.1 MAG: hypothetical protein BECKTUN1418F_GA0071002_11104 [Candidatus Kentron sp. TUN]VFK65362.1 MAG: hypothetical protein BECKTUN1418E_GA0071001_11064 [Candidatus Kentron sp. TUN]
MKDKDDIIQRLKLEKHVEGGYFSETYRSGLQIQTDRVGEGRSLLTAIYYMLTDDNPIGYFHTNLSDAIHFFHAGEPALYLIVHPDGRLEKRLLGADPEKGCQLQLLVEGGCWKASVLRKGSFSLIGEVITPGFEYQDNTMAEPDGFKALFPELWDELSPYVLDAGKVAG